jgi:hypothetical protein
MFAVFNSVLSITCTPTPMCPSPKERSSIALLTTYGEPLHSHIKVVRRGPSYRLACGMSKAWCNVIKSDSLYVLKCKI